MEGQIYYRVILEQFNDFFMWDITATIILQDDNIDDRNNMNAAIAAGIDVGSRDFGHHSSTS